MARKTHQSNLSAFVLTAVAVVLTMAITAPAQAAGFEEKLSVDAESLELFNLIGEIRIEPASGGDFQVEILVQGDDASRDRIEIEVTRGSLASVNVKFPVDTERSYVYPRLGRGSSTSFQAGQTGLRGVTGFWSRLTGQDRISVAGAGRGLEVWADVIIRVPTGARLVVKHGVGKMFAAQVEANLSLSSRSGAVSAADIEGHLIVDTGSGHVEVANLNGDLNIDTGSGRVEVRGVRGDEVTIDTGSGRVRVDDIRCVRLDIDTGSGRVTAIDVDADELRVDTGSGSVSLALTRMGTGDFDIDTGSGGIDVQLPGDASARVVASTGSGGVHLDLRGARVLHKEKDELRFEVGEGAARMSLATGSGGIRIASR